MYLITAMVIFFPIDSIANNNSRPAPLHIKIDVSQKHNTKKGFSIKLGKVPQKTEYKKTVTNQTDNENIVPPTPKAEPKVIKKEICNQHPDKLLNRDKNLSDSLKSYIKSQNRSQSIIDDIYKASIDTNTDFEHLIITAMMESDLGRVTESKTSSARGIFQYIEPTWVSLIKRYRQRISQYSKTKLLDENNKNTNNSDILELRYNTRVAALIKAYQLNDEAKILAKYTNGKRINTTDHYIMHMLGSYQARTFYSLINNKSDKKLTNIKSANLQEAIKLNPTFFYDAENNALNAEQAYKQFHKKISKQYKKLRMISDKYGNKGDKNYNCEETPNITTISSVGANIINNKI